MKKMIIIFLLYIVGCRAHSETNNFLLEKENENHSGSFTQADKLMEEYSLNNEEENINEYDHHICDDVQPPKPSKIRLFLERIVGKMLIQYFMIKETTRFYGKKLKNIVYKCLGKELNKNKKQYNYKRS